jgi:hypothetical protein
MRNHHPHPHSHQPHPRRGQASSQRSQAVRRQPQHGAPVRPQWRSQSADWEEDDVSGHAQQEAFQGFEQHWERGESEPWAEEDEGFFGGQPRSGEMYPNGYGTGGGYAGGGGDYYGQGSPSGNFGQGGYGSRGVSPGGMGFLRGDTQRRYAPGPKGYKRSDERIKEDVSDRISQMNMVDASDVEVAVKGGEVTLTGTVPNRVMKWQLENMIDTVAGVTEVHNQLRVRREDTSASKHR